MKHYYRHEGDFDADAKFIFKIVTALRVLGWIFLGSLLLGALATIVYDKWPRSTIPAPTFQRVEPKNPNSSNDPIFRILSESA